MALQLGALREALIEAGSSPEKAANAAEELAGYDREFTQLRAEMKAGFFDLKSEMSAVRSDLRADIADLRSDLRADIADLRSESRSDIKLLKWMVGTAVAGIVATLLHTLLH